MKKIFSNLKTDKMTLVLLGIISVLALAIFFVTNAYLGSIEPVTAFTTVSVSSCGDFTLTEENETINLANSYPVSDAIGLQNAPYSFSVKNTCAESSTFNIYLVVNETSTMSDSAIKANLNLGDSNNLTNLEVKTLSADIISQIEKLTKKEVKTAYVLDTKTLVSNTTVDFDLRLWIDALAGNEEENKVFDATIVIGD